MRLKVRHVLVNDGVRNVPGWYVVDTAHRPARTVAGPFTGRDYAAGIVQAYRHGHPQWSHAIAHGPCSRTD
jgi:hypothetical protein